jgi:hypothetical protein
MDIFNRPPTGGKSLVSKNGAILVLLASLQHDLNQQNKEQNKVTTFNNKKKKQAFMAEYTFSIRKNQMSKSYKIVRPR